MKCIDPVLCYTINDGKKKIYRHFSLIHRFRLQAPHQVFSCGQCLVCRKKRAYELAIRCVLHASLYRDNCFLTLTYDEKKPDYHNVFVYEDIQKFKKRLRQHCQRNHNGKRIEIFNVHEYGKNGKKHWHLIIFNWDDVDKRLHTVSGENRLYTSPTITQLWPYGFNVLGDVSEASAMYQAQYVEKDFKNGNRANAKKSHSKHSGLGRPYFLKNYSQILRLGYVPIAGRKVPVPRYFQKIAHKHYCHYYDKRAFFDVKERKALYRPFKHGEEIKEMADLYIDFKHQKDLLVLEFEKDWNDVLTKYFEDQGPTDFQKSGANLLHDLRNKISEGDF